jgi:hypothetical protein
MKNNTGIANIHKSAERYIYNKTVVGIRYTFSSFILKEVIKHKEQWEALNRINMD